MTNQYIWSTSWVHKVKIQKTTGTHWIHWTVPTQTKHILHTSMVEIPAFTLGLHQGIQAIDSARLYINLHVYLGASNKAIDCWFQCRSHFCDDFTNWIVASPWLWNHLRRLCNLRRICLWSHFSIQQYFSLTYAQPKFCELCDQHPGFRTAYPKTRSKSAHSTVPVALNSNRRIVEAVLICLIFLWVWDALSLVKHLYSLNKTNKLVIKHVNFILYTFV